MPLHYGSQIEEHHAVRRAAGMFDTSHMLAIDLGGTGACDFLRYALANDIARLDRDGRALYSCMLAEDGGVIDDLIAYRIDDRRYRLIVNAATAASDLDHLNELRDRRAPGLVLAPCHGLAMIAVQGPLARPKTMTALPHTAPAGSLPPFHSMQCGSVFVSRTGYTGEDGFELLMPAEDAPQAWARLLEGGIRPCGLGARDTLRLEAGMNLYGQDMDRHVTPLESGLAWTVDRSTPRDFAGRSALDARPATKALRGLVLASRAGVIRSHQSVRTAGGEGTITSGGFSPTLGRSIALARLPAGVAADDWVEVTLRDRTLQARVVTPPFVRRGEPRVSLPG